MRPSVLLLVLAAIGCKAPEAVPWPAVEPGPPVAGAAEGTIDLPIGTPLGGFSARADYLSGQSRQDKRASAYSVGFVESTGVHMRPTVKAVWLDNGDERLVLIKVDLIYSYDNLVSEVARRLEAATGEALAGRVTISANHSHHSWGPFSDQTHFYLGGDRYNEEIFQRMVEQLTDVALQAWSNRQPAELGTGWARDWDPDDRVYRDRRGENNELAVWDDVAPGYGKDPHLNVIRIDEAGTGDPIALIMTFGIHGITLSEKNSLVSGDSGTSLEVTLQEEFDEPVVVMHLQGAGGDASPAGSDREQARLETLGEYARDAIMGLYDAVPTSDAPIAIESASRHIWQNHSSIQVTRDGTVDWTYRPYEEGYIADNVIWGEDGSLLSPIDEFNAPVGAAFCGSDAPLIPAGDIGAHVYPYSACMDVALVSRILLAIFKLDEEEVPLPLPESMKAGTTATLIGPLATLDVDGTEVERDLYTGFFPAEPTAMYAEQFRRRAAAELGHPMALTVGYSQDHEGYFLIPEDWLQGGYEPNINLWGPLQAEHVMEGVLSYSGQLLGNGVNDAPDPFGYYAQTEYLDRDLPTILPDVAAEAGTPFTTPPEYFWVPPEIGLDLTVPDRVRRVQDMVQIGWIGGDPMVDLPRVVLERDDGGTWVEVTTHAGRPITDALPDILVGYTPDPLYPVDADQTHYFWAGWQAVGHVRDRVSFPLGTYRLRVDGHTWTGGDTTWPWTTDTYAFTSPPFEVVGADITLTLDGDVLIGSFVARPDGYRLVDLEGSSRGNNPVRGTVEVAWGDADGALGSTSVEAEPTGGTSRLGGWPEGATWVRVTDAWGNTGVLDLGGDAG